MQLRNLRRAVPLLGALALLCSTAAVRANPDSLVLRIEHPAYADVRHDDTVTFECSGLAVLTTADLRVENVCAGAPTFGFSEFVNTFPTPIDGALSVMSCTFTAEDDCQRVGLLRIHVRMVDTTAPLLQNVPPELLTLEAGDAIPGPAAVYAIDNCTRNPEVRLGESERPATATSPRTLLRTWRVSDEAGNEATAQQRITVGEPISGGVTSTSGSPVGSGGGGADCTDVQAFEVDELTVDLLGCGEAGELCLPIRQNYTGELSVDGERVPTLTYCDQRERIAYDLAALFADGVGPYEMIWRYGVGAYRERIAAPDSVLAFVARFATGWSLDREGERLVGPADDRYGALTAIDASSGAVRTTEPAHITVAAGFSVALTPGEHVLATTHASGCRDSLALTVNCRPTADRYVTAVVGVTGKHCLPVAGSADDYAFELVSETLGPAAKLHGFAGGCVEFSALQPGEGQVLVEYCHGGTGVCDRVRLHVEVVAREQVKPPSANADVMAVAYNGQRLYHITANDEIVSGITQLFVAEGATLGEVRIDALHRLHYTAPRDWCGRDRVAYTVCNAGGCDTASVRVEVTCDELIVFNGFSPNADGVNDAFTVIGIENYPDNQLRVFSRHGQEVYSAEGYANDWDGSHRGTPLSDGTYFYVLTVDGLDPMSGYLQIAR